MCVLRDIQELQEKYDKAVRELRTEKRVVAAFDVMLGRARDEIKALNTLVEAHILREEAFSYMLDMVNVSMSFESFDILKDCAADIKNI